MNIFIVTFLVLMLAVSGRLHAQDDAYREIRYTAADGLLGDYNSCVLRDHRGFIWFGTYEGLMRFDGYQFRAFQHDADDSSSISNDFVAALAEDRIGNIWIGTENGLNRYSRKTNRFKRLYAPVARAVSTLSNDVWCLSVDSIGDLWVGTEKGLTMIRCGADGFSDVRYASASAPAFGTVTAILPEKNGTIYVGSKSGFTVLTPSPHGYVLSKRLAIGWVRSITRLLNGSLLVQIDQWKYMVFSPSTQSLRMVRNPARFVADADGSIFLKRGRIISKLDSISNSGDSTAVFHDHCIHTYRSVTFFLTGVTDGKLWLSTEDGTVLLSPRRVIFRTGRAFDPDTEPTVNPTIRSLYVTSSGLLCLGTLYGLLIADSSGRVVVSPCLKCRTRFAHNTFHGEVWSFLEEPDGSLLLGTTTGLVRYDVKTRRMRPCAGKLPRIQALYRESPERLWAGSRWGGVFLLNAKYEVVRRFSHDPGKPGSISNDYIYCFLRDSRGLLWIGTNYGLNRWNPSDSTFVHYLHDRRNPGSIGGNNVVSLIEDRHGDVWAGIVGVGLARYHRESDTFTHYGKKEGMPALSVCRIMEDRSGAFWISGTVGLARYNPVTRASRLYTTEDGLPGTGFSVFAGCRANSGELWYGTELGYFSFSPEKIVEHRRASHLLMTSVKILGREKHAEMDNGDTLTVHASENLIQMQFSTLEFRKPMRSRYAFRLEGSTDAWIDLGTNRELTLTGLDPGEYVLRIRGATSDAVSEAAEMSLIIRVIPPYYRTWWFRASAAVLAAAVILFLFRRRQKYVRNLGRSESRYRMITELMSDYAYLYRVREDSSVELVWMTDSFTLLTGYPAQATEERDFVKRLIHPEDLQMSLEGHRRLLSGEKLTLEHRILTRSGETRWVERRSSPVVNPKDNRVEYFYGVVSDITARKEAEQRMRSLAGELATTEDRERRRMATYLHDVIGQSLTLAYLKLHGWQKRERPGDPGLDDIRASLDQAIQDAQTLTFDLCPPIVYELSLGEAVAWLVSRLRLQHGVQIETAFIGDKVFMNPELHALLFQAVRELLVNSIKHAGAARIGVEVRRENGNLRVVVHDDGIGFHPDSRNNHGLNGGGFGLFNIRERLADFGARLTIDSATGAGTRISIDVDASMLIIPDEKKETT